MNDNEINEETIKKMNNANVRSEIIKTLDGIDVGDETVDETIKEEPKTLNKFETNRIFNDGMDAFLKNKKNLFDCPYDKDTDTNRNMAWLEGFKYGAEYFIDNFANSYIKEMIDKIKIDVNDHNKFINSPMITDKMDAAEIDEILATK